VSIHSYVYDTPRDTSAACALKILDLLKEKIAGNTPATLAVSGGSTPKLLFEELAKSGFDWSRVHLFWVDERAVPPTDVQSNYRLAKEHLLDPAHFPAANVHRIHAELEPAVAAMRYAEDIRKFFGLKAGEAPQFDVIHRGMGSDAHTASLFPLEPLIDDHENLVAAVFAERMQTWRITLLQRVLESAHHTIMLVAGDDKAEPLRTVLEGPYDPQHYPAQIGTRDGRKVLWFLDKPAARLLG